MIAEKITEVKFNTRSMNIAYPAGVYDKNTIYECTVKMSPFVEEDGSYYLMNKIGTWLGTETGLSPKEDYAQHGNDATWIYMEKYKAVFLEVLFADFAKLGSAVFLEDYMISQYGVDASGQFTASYQNFDPSKLGESNCPFTPKTFINWLTGKASFGDVEINGVLNEACKIFDVNDNTFTAVNPDIRKYYIPLGSSGKVLNLNLDEIKKTKVPINIKFYCMGMDATVNFVASDRNMLPIVYYLSKKPTSVLSKSIKTVHMSQGNFISVTFLNQNESVGYNFHGIIENYDHYEYESGTLDLIIRSIQN